MLLSVAADSAAAQSTGDSEGVWDLVTSGGASVCRLFLTTQIVSPQGQFRVRIQGGPNCHDSGIRRIALWVVRGNTLYLSDWGGNRIANLNQQGPNWAAGDVFLYRRGYRY
jgi:hypothetical protein